LIAGVAPSRHGFAAGLLTGREEARENKAMLAAVQGHKDFIKVKSFWLGIGVKRAPASIFPLPFSPADYVIEQRDPRFIALSGAYPNACLFRLKADLPDVVDARLLRFLFYLEILTLAKIADGANRGGNPARPGGNNIR
jgi:hypothetical protein